MPLAIVTGASRGMGRDVALKLADRGYTVACMARNADELRALAEEREGLIAAPVDLTDPEALDRVANGIIEEHGPCSVLINNAGYGLRAAVEEIPMDRWRHQMELNLFACVRLTQLVLPGMRQVRSGRIINISSIAGRVATPYGGAYCATKFALEAISDSLRLEMRPWGIGVSLVEPGPVATNFLSAASTASEGVADTEEGPYAAPYKILRDQLGRLHSQAWASERVADLIVEAATGPRAPARVRAYSFTLALAIAARNLLPGLFDRVLARRFMVDASVG